MRKVTYRGTEKYTLVQSLRDAKAVLDQLDLGPQTAAWFADWKGGHPFIDLLSAQTEGELVTAMHTTGVRATLGLSAPSSPARAMTAIADGINDNSVRLYRTLSAWGAFQQFNVRDDRTPGRELNDEIDSWLASTDIHNIAERDTRYGGNSPYMEHADVSRAAFLTGIAGQDPEMAARLEQATAVYLDMDRIGAGAEIPALFALQPEQERKIAVALLMMMSTTPEHRRAVDEVPRPFELYGIAVDNPPADPARRKNLQETLRRRLLDATQDFGATDQLYTTSYSYSNSAADDKTLYFFYATREAAQQAADALTGARVIEYAPGQKPRVVLPSNPYGPRPPSPGQN